MDIRQAFLTPEEVNKFSNIIGYRDISKKFTVYDMLQYFVATAVGEWNSFRSRF
jgi:hypothetical protein